MRRLLLILCLYSSPTLAAPEVVTSILPLQEIAGEIMQGVATPGVIIAAQASAHHFAFKPSHMRLLQQADLVIWIDRHFESGFNRVAEVLPASTHRLELMPLLGIDNGDGHFWYSPRLLRDSIALIADALVKVDPANESTYRSNAERLALAVASWREHMLERRPIQTPRIVTDHDFLGHFARDLGTFEIAAIQDKHDEHGGLRRLNQVQDWLRATEVSCLLTLDHSPPPLAGSLADKYRLRTIRVATPEDADPQHRGILQRLDQLRDALDLCLSGK